MWSIMLENNFKGILIMLLGFDVPKLTALVSFYLFFVSLTAGTIKQAYD